MIVTQTSIKMKRLTLTIVLLAFGGLAAKAQTTNPWLDSTQALPPLAVANGVVVNMAELKPDLISSVDVFKGEEAKERCGALGINGCIFIKTNQQFDAATPRKYKRKKSIPRSVRMVVFMLNGVMVSDTIRISKAAVREVDVLLGSNRVGVPANSACVSIWTLGEAEKRLMHSPGFPSSKGGIRIRGVKAGK